MTVRYRCEACGEEDDYVVEMPEGWRHEVGRTLRRCGGLLVRVDGGIGSTRAPEKGSMERTDGKSMGNRGMSITQYMEHSNRGGGKRSYLKAWKDKDPYAVTVWLSTQASIYTLWRHPFQRVESVTDKQTKESRREVWQNKLVCWETVFGGEDTLQKQYWRDKETGRRELPPQVCPHCLLVEDVYQRVLDGRLKWTAPLFRFTGSDPHKTGFGGMNVGDVWVHAGGFCGLFNRKDLSDAQKREMGTIPKEEGGPVYQSQAFRQNNWAKMEYVYTVVNNDDVAAGLQVAIEPNLLGDKMRLAIQSRIKAAKAAGQPEELGNPISYPYPFRWEHNPSKEVSFDKKYDAIPLDRVKPSAAVEKLIRDTSPPDVSGLLEPFNWKTHRALLERHALAELPWDSYFEPVRRLEERRASAAASAAENPRVPEVGRSPAPAAPPPPPSAPEADTFVCDKCDADMLPTDTVCKNCGERYDVVADPPPPPPPRPKRSEVRAGAAPAPAQPAPRGNLGPMAPPEDDVFAGGDVDPTDDIPF